MREDLRSAIKRVVDDEIAMFPAPPADLRGRAVRNAAARLRSRRHRRPSERLVVALAVALAVAAVGVLLGVHFRPLAAPQPAGTPPPPATAAPSPSPSPSPSATAGPTPVASPSAAATAPPPPAGSPGTPPGTMAAVSAYDPVGRHVLLFGGSIGQAVGTEGPPETWVWGGSGWFQLSPATSPPTALYAVAATMGSQGPVIVVGVLEPQGYTGPAVPTWRWDGGSWTLLHPLHSPPAGIAAGMAYDPAHRQAVLFTQGQTWTWDGADWTQQHPATSPPNMQEAAMATQPGGSGVVLFGGSAPNNQTTTFGDTWTWNGSTWTPHASTGPPAPRYYAAMAYDPATGRALLFGGLGAAGTALTDTWAWDGGAWTRLAQQGPSPWGRVAMAVDESTGQVVLFGDFGTSLPNRTTGTWTWSGSGWVRR